MERNFKTVTVCTDGKCGRCIACALEKKSNAYAAVQSMTNSYYKGWRDNVARVKEMEAMLVAASAQARGMRMGIYVLAGIAAALFVCVCLVARALP